MRPSLFSRLSRWLWCLIVPLKSLLLFGLLLFGSLALVVPAQAQSSFNVEVQVVNQGDSERTSAYWLAFDRVLRREVETRVRIEPAQREELMKNPSLFVQSFRYRGYNDASDRSLLATRTVRNGTQAGAVIAVAFPADLAPIIQQRLIPVVAQEEVPVETPVLAMVAVEQQGDQFIIGGERGKKFQARALQLAAANNLQLEFPVIEPADQELISAADILSADSGRINGFVAQRYQSDKVLTGALYLLAPTTWQSDWSYTSPDGQPQSFSLTTATLDEALVSAMTQISPGGGYLGSTLTDAYSDVTDGNFERTGVPVRVENIRSLADYDNVLAALKQLDDSIVTESIEPESMVFRATDQGAARVRDALIASRSFETLNADQFVGELSFRYIAR